MRENKSIERKVSKTNKRRLISNTSHTTRKRFARQDPKVRRHGPQPRRVVYANAIEAVLNGKWGEEWLLSEEIAYQANKHISSHWTQLTRFSVGAIMRVYEAKGYVESKNPHNKPKLWKRLKKIA